MTVVFLTSASGSPWSKPGDWTDAGHTVELVGCGGQGGLGSTGANHDAGTGGGGGGYLGLTRTSGAFGASMAFAVKANNDATTDTHANATFWEGTSTSNTYEANCGLAGLDATGVAAGGAGGSGITNGSPSPITYSTTPYTGGTGGSSGNTKNSPGPGGGGAAGPTGAGKNGGNVQNLNGGSGGGGSNGGSSTAGVSGTGNANGSDGGDGTSGSGHGTGSTSPSSPNGSAGTIGGGGGGGYSVQSGGGTLSGYNGGTVGNASDWVQTSDSSHAGVGGGGGGTGCTTATTNCTMVAGAGGNYGGGGGAVGGSRATGSTRTRGSGGEGLIVITYTPGAATQDITPPLYTDASTFFAPTLTPGSVDVAPGLVTDSGAIFSATALSTFPLYPSRTAFRRDSTGVLLSQNDLRAQNDLVNPSGYALAVADQRSRGKLYLEAVIERNDPGSLGRYVAIAFRNPTDSWIACYDDGALYSDTAGDTDAISTTYYQTGDLMQVAIDLDAGRIWHQRVRSGTPDGWNKRLSSISPDLTPDPATGIGGWSFSVAGKPTEHIVGLWQDQTIVSAATMNFGSTAFSQSIPSGFSAWQQSPWIDYDEFYAPTLAQVSAISPPLFSDADTIFSAVAAATATIAPPIILDADQLLAPTIAQGIAPPLFSDLDVFYAPTVAPGAVGLTAALFSDSDAFLVPRVNIVDYLRPDADDADGTWTDQLGGTNLFASIDEIGTPDDNDYIQSSGDPTADIARLRLSNPSTGVTMPVTLRVRHKRSGTGTVNLTVRLKQATTVIATRVYNDLPVDFATVESDLTQAEFDAITDFADLFIEFQADKA